MLELDTVFRSGVILSTDPTIHQRNMRHAFFDAEDTFPEVDVVATWCDCTPWNVAWGVRVLEEIRQQEPISGRRKRQISFRKIMGANHFVSFYRRLLPAMLITKITVSLGGPRGDGPYFGGCRAKQSFYVGQHLIKIAIVSNL